MNSDSSDGAALLAAVGNTPLVEIRLAAQPDSRVRLFAKLESLNPSGSIKDRPVARMLVRALADGHLAGGKRLLDSSSGNAGVSYAMFGAALGIPVTVVVPGNASRERLERMRAHGAELILTDPVEGYDCALLTCRNLASQHPERYWHCDQYANDENWKSHYEGTGAEILAQFEERRLPPPDALIAGIGTGGTLTGLGRRLREANPHLHIAAVIPETFPGIDGLRRAEPDAIVPPIFDEALPDIRCTVSLDEAVAMGHRLAAIGLFVGPSSGAYVHVALQMAASKRWKTVVTLLNDGGERYVSTGLWSALKVSRRSG